VSSLRWTLVALLVASTFLVAAGVIAERSTADTHTEPVAARPQTPDDGGHRETDEAGHSEKGRVPASEAGEAGHAATSEGSSESERLLGIDLEATPLVVLAVLGGLAMAAAVAGGAGRRRAFLLAVAVIGLVWAALDVREVFHQLDESQTGVALIAIAVTALHIAVAGVSASLTRRESVLSYGA
jgi:hypothetical protein